MSSKITVFSKEMSDDKIEETIRLNDQHIKNITGVEDNTFNAVGKYVEKLKRGNCPLSNEELENIRNNVTHYINKNKVICYIADVMWSCRYNEWMYRIWIVDKMNYLCVSIEDFNKKWRQISNEDANKITKRFGYDSISSSYFLMEE